MEKDKKKKLKRRKKLIKSLKYKLGLATGASLILTLSLAVVGYMYIQVGMKNHSIIEPVSKNDWVKGNDDAPITIIGYLDPECPYCKELHPELEKLVRDNKKYVNYVYRHFPQATVHDKAFKEALAIECAGDIGGEDKFWDYVDHLYEETEADNTLEEDKLYEFAEDVKIDKKKVKECVKDKKFEDRINEHVEQAYIHASIEEVPQTLKKIGTPYVVILYEDQVIPIVPSIELIKYRIEQLTIIEKNKN